MKTAREVAERLALDVARDFRFNTVVDLVSAAIEARDEAWNLNINQNDRDWETKLAALTAERNRLREALERLAATVCQTCRRDADARAALKAQP